MVWRLISTDTRLPFFLNIVCTCVVLQSTYETNLTCTGTYAHILLHVRALHVCHQQSVITSVYVVLSERSVVRTTVTHLHTY